jgi:hypothetical protein
MPHSKEAGRRCTFCTKSMPRLWVWDGYLAMGAGTSMWSTWPCSPSISRRGLGDVILTVLLERIRREAPAGAHVNLIADRPGRRLYARHGFTPTAPDSIGMARTLD